MNANSPDILGNPNFQLAAMANDAKSQMRAQIADAIISTKTWIDMNKQERKICLDYLVSDSETETELRHRLTEIGISYFAISWQDVDPNDKTSIEAQMIVKALGDPIAKNGAMVMVNTMDDFN